MLFRSNENDSPPGTPWTGFEENSYSVVTSAGNAVSATLDGFEVTGGNGEAVFGGGIHVSSGSVAQVLACTFYRNRAGYGGGAMVDDSAPWFDRCAFYGNTALQFGGGMYAENTAPLIVTNSVIAGNYALATGPSPNGGGGIQHRAGSIAIINCTVYGNWSASDGGGVNTDATVAFRNSIMWDNAAGGVGPN